MSRPPTPPRLPRPYPSGLRHRLAVAGATVAVVGTCLVLSIAGGGSTPSASRTSGLSGTSAGAGSASSVGPVASSSAVGGTTGGASTSSSRRSASPSHSASARPSVSRSPSAPPGSSGRKPGAASSSAGSTGSGGSGGNGDSAATVSGVAMPVGNLPGWHQVLADDFTGSAALGSFASSSYAKRYYAYSGFNDTSKRGTYDPARVMSVHDGVLDWYLHSQGGRPYVESIVPRSPATNWGQLYGRFSIRFRSDVMPGYKLAFMLWPDSNRWVEGEVDFPEVGGLTSGNYIYANRYGAGRSVLTGDTTGFRTRVAAAGSGWHTATIEWSPGRLTYSLDGSTLGTTTVRIPSTSMHWVLQAETALSGPAPAGSVNGHLQVDWLTMYTFS